MSEDSKLQAVILIGGKGTRLGGRVGDQPKPLLNVAGKPFLDHLLFELQRHGFTDVILLAGYRPEAVQARYGAGSNIDRRFHMTISVVVENTPQGTGGAIRGAGDRLAHSFYLLNGDSLFDFNYLDLACSEPGSRRPDRSEPAPVVTMALRHLDDAGRFGLVEVERHRVTAFREKPDAPVPGLVNAGVYLMNRSILDWIPDQPCSLENDIFPKLVQRGLLAARVYDGFFIDIGVPEDLERADRILADRLTRPAVFFDRDNTLIRDDGYTHRPEDLDWLPGARQAIRRLNDAGILVFVVTNQAGVAKGHYDEAAIARFHDHMNAQLRAEGAHIDAFRYCPHHPEGSVPGYARSCDWRKPGAGMVRDLIAHWPVDTRSSLMIGDQPSDVEAGRAAGIPSRLVPTGGPEKLIAEWLEDRAGSV